MRAKFKSLEENFKILERKITSQKHHKLFLSIFTIISLFLVIIIPIYNVYSAEEPPTTKPITQEVLGNTSTGTVIKEGPYGDSNSQVKVAYILGQHPRENISHRSVEENVKENSDSLKYCYYLYYINVTDGASNFWKGRMNGQLLSNNYVVPDIARGKFRLAVDVHGTDGYYPENLFIFTPIEKGSSLDIAQNLTNTTGFVYYYPFTHTSPDYTTIPLIKKGIPSIVYESFKKQPYNLIKEQDKKFVLSVDNLNFASNPCY